ncbi:MAG: SCO1664 family protein [Actinobacteria bacterium]|jgi:uncharacterized repeat protein (TIGR03843 family)|nr:SCO1664 family protein [Actinomycetota bacterium]
MDIADSSRLKFLEQGDLEVLGRLVDASNASLLCQLITGEKVIYKPIAGERPLWDFNVGNLASREVAAFYLSEVGGFNCVPPTVLREGPYGLGAVQLWIDTDENVDQVEFGQGNSPLLRSMAIFDSVINNTDRKFGHILVDKQGAVFGCDHGVCFHEEDKLRTVLWQWTEQPLSIDEIDLLNDLKNQLDLEYLITLISKNEVNALLMRIERLIESKVMPAPSEQWPAIPWPPY